MGVVLALSSQHSSEPGSREIDEGSQFHRHVTLRQVDQLNRQRRMFERLQHRHKQTIGNRACRLIGQNACQAEPENGSVDCGLGRVDREA